LKATPVDFKQVEDKISGLEDRIDIKEKTETS
jgi:hypothetical protein